jgi:hypothetical protein
MPTQPPAWSDAQLVAAASRSKAAFREQRVEEPLELYYEKFERFRSVVEDLLEESVDLSLLKQQPVQFLNSKDRLKAIRYLASPAISEDDLKTIADVPSLAITVLARKPEDAKSVVTQVLENIDRNRFPWLSEDREPTEAERLTAVVSTVALVAAQEVQTERRNSAKKEQEGAVAELLLGLGFTQVPTRKATMLHEAPGNMQFSGEAELGPGKADVIVGLPDGRKMLIECKVSNSATNSYKRINHEAAGKAAKWTGAFGTAGVVPVAVIAGVFSPAALSSAQAAGLHIVWAHDFTPLRGFIVDLMPMMPRGCVLESDDA